MIRLAAEADLEVQGSERQNLCEKCFAVAEAGAEFCPECGAPLSHEPGAEGSDIAIYPELARANLLRMRGDYHGAQEVCLAILRRFPNNATGNTLLGDIAAERGDLEHAIEWYELALDLQPDSAVDRQKLDAVRARLEKEHAATAVSQLELPKNQPKLSTYIVIATAAIVLAGVVAFAMGRQSGQQQAQAGDSPYQLPKTKAQTEPIVKDPQPRGAGPVVTTSSVRTQEDIALTELVAGRSSAGAALIDASEDPRTHGARLTFAVEGTEEPRLLAAKLANAAYLVPRDIQFLYIRGVRANRLVYCASSARPAWTLTQEAKWQGRYGSDATALADAVLTDEWVPAAPSENP